MKVDGRTDLHYAAADGDLKQIEALLATGAPVDAADSNGWRALHFAAQTQSVAIVRALLAAGAAVDAQDAHGNTPLWRAVFASRGNGEVIAVLRAAGADPMRENHSGISPRTLAHGIANYPVREFFRDLDLAT